MKIEHKTFPLEIASIDCEGRTFTGYAAAFGNIDAYDDIIHMGAFSKTLSERFGKIKLLWQHDTTEPLGRPALMREDARGLYVECVISDTARGRDALALLKDGAIGEMSIGYEAIAGGTDYSKAADGRTVRNLKEIKLWEISLVTFPANEEAQVTGLKSFKASDFLTSFQEAVVREQMFEMRWKIEDAFRTSMFSILDDEEMADDAKLSLLSTTCDQYRDALKGWAQRYLILKPKGETDHAVSMMAAEMAMAIKAGRVISAANGAEMMACMDDLMSGMSKMQGAHDRLMEMMKRAGMMDSEDEMPDEEMSKSAPDQAAEENTEMLEEKAGPVNPPTSNAISIDQVIAEIAELELLEVTRHGNHSN